MFLKLLVVICSCGACGAWLLAARHERVQAISEVTQAQLRINRQDERLWMLRAKVAQRITPSRVEEMTAGLVNLHPIAPYNALSDSELAMVLTSPDIGPPSLLNEPGKPLRQIASADEAGKPTAKPDAKANVKPVAKADGKKPDAKKKSVTAPTRVAKNDETTIEVPR